MSGAWCGVLGRWAGAVMMRISSMGVGGENNVLKVTVKSTPKDVPEIWLGWC